MEIQASAPNVLTDRVKSSSCERPKAQGGVILDLLPR